MALVFCATMILINGGCRSRFHDIHKIETVESATLVVASTSTVTIDMKPIRKMLAHAEWIDGTPIKKGGWYEPRT